MKNEDPKVSKDGSGSDGAPRALKVKVKTAKRRTASSTRWLQRQLNEIGRAHV